MQVDLSGKVALVTGAARNIGKSIADLFAGSGATVYYADLDLPALQSAAAGQSNARAVEMDITRQDQIDAAIRTILSESGRLDILVNNAGVNTAKYRVPIDEFPKEEWDRLLEVDLTGLYMVSKSAAQPMLRQGSGRIINITSVVGLVPLRLQCAFAAAKAGVVNLTKAMALELAPRGVLVNAIAPGSILTEGTKSLFYGQNGQFNDRMREMLSHIPLGKPGESNDIGYAALFLAAPESKYINGHVLTVDGGWTAGYTRDF
ncbi:MAG: SDR family oxidoreductase [Phycisphaerae bacterium]|nr:SDR family oxidoreductase [Phycisphaerae bacterium]